MSTHFTSGGCYCGNIRFEMATSNPIGAYPVRACDCDYCQKHGANYLSDNKGQLKIRVKTSTDLQRFKQGAQNAGFLLCRNCGVLVAVCYTDDGVRYGAINARAIEGEPPLQQAAVVSPQQLQPNERIARWKQLWFAKVDIAMGK